ncbi:uncharacterized protein KQ657_001558 [Scheffersomyces spartinae]|uniref:Glutaredoxin domain-containing protein n=1 Tax=Scheffersomyces spartinae TaxID=45513 RepID=A0A9P8AGX9_9ASCO|nr:uncharacterized protein KQ657_001558 [Scheffersomyces spartinae]KAG7192775.1 hypothetical protein KQ657_001558 [Scheffersomyces spartinae]
MSEPYLSQAQKYIDENPYFMLSKSWCPDCHYTYKVWEQYGVVSKVKVLELDKLSDQKEAAQLEAAFTQLAGLKWVPTIWFNGKRLGTEADLKRWDQEGSLTKIFTESKLI